MTTSFIKENPSNPPLAGVGVDAIPQTGFFNFSQKWEELFLKTKFLLVGSSLGYLSVKKISDRTYHLGSKIRQREGARGLATTPIEQKLTYFSNHENDIQS